MVLMDRMVLLSSLVMVAVRFGVEGRGPVLLAERLELLMVQAEAVLMTVRSRVRCIMEAMVLPDSFYTGGSHE